MPVGPDDRPFLRDYNKPISYTHRMRRQAMNKVKQVITDTNRRVFILLLFICFYFSIIPAALTAETLRCDLTAGGYKLAGSAAGGYTIEMADAGYGRLDSPGDPALPEKIIELRVPEDGVISNLKLTVDGADSAILPKAYTIVPQDPVMLDTIAWWGVGKAIVDGKNTYVYGDNAFFPGETVELLPTVTKKEPDGSGGTKYRLVRYLRLAFRPFACNPVTRQVKLTKNASVTVSYDVAAAAVISPKAAPAAPADYVIITTNAIVSNSRMLQRFVRMKEEDGHAVRIVTEDDFDSLTGQAPNGRAEKIRQWLMDNYLALGIDYVLLVGNPDPDDPLDDSDNDKIGDIPMKMCYARFCEPEYREYPTDYFYKDLVGNWDLDGDLFFGEIIAIDHEKNPPSLVNPDHFSIRWTGKIQLDYADDDYCLTVLADDGVRVYLDGDPVPLIDDWTDHYKAGVHTKYFRVADAGLHDITVEYYQKAGDAVIRLFWKNTGEIPEYNAIPADHLYHYNLATGSYVPGGLTAFYYNNVDLSGPWVMANVELVDHAWLTGDDGPGGRQPQAMVTVGRIPVYDDDYAALDDILTKIMDYETAPDDISWRRSILLPMKPTGDTNFGYDLAEPVKADIADPLGFSSFRIYDKDYAPSGPTPDLWPCTVLNVLAEWQNHYGMVTWYTHGTPGGAVDVMDIGRAVELDDAYPSMAFQASCDNGKPESHENLGYSLLKNGCVATVSASRMIGAGKYTGDIHADNAPNLAYFFTSYLLNNGGAPLAAGDALKKTQDNMEYVGIGTMAFNLYGDPDCYLLTTHPRTRPIPEAGGPYHCLEGGSVVLDANGSYNPEAGVLEYRWDLDGDDAWDTAWSSDHTYAVSNCIETVIISVQVMNQAGYVSRDSAYITVENVPPTAEAGPDLMAAVNEEVQFHGSATDPGDNYVSLRWDFGDGTPTGYGPDPTHAFTAAGTYTVTLTAMDNKGAEDTDSLRVRVFGVSPLSNENPARPWTKVQGNFTLTNDTVIKSEKTLSLKLEGTGYMVTGTTVFASGELAGYSNRLSLDVYLPSPAANPHWLGQIQLVITCPSANIYSQPVGQVELTGLSLDTWHTVAFNLPQYAVNLFSGSYNDIRISVAVNTNQAAGNPYRIDDLRFTGTIVIPPPAGTAQRLENVWSAAAATPTYLTLNSAGEDAPVYCQTLHADWPSQQWVVEPVEGFTDRVRFRCAWNGTGTEYYLTATGAAGSGGGDPVVGKALHMDWSSQVWIKEAGRGGSTRFKSAWSMGTYLTVKSTDDFSAVVCQPDHPDWSSQEWNIK